MRTEYAVKENFTFSSSSDSVQIRSLSALNYFIKHNGNEYYCCEAPKLVLENNNYYLLLTSLTACGEVLCDKKVKLMLDSKSVEQWLKTNHHETQLTLSL